MIQLENIPAEFKIKHQAVYHTYCLTCNDPNDTVLQLIDGVDKSKAMQIAIMHEKEQGYGHSILVDYSFVEVPVQKVQLYAAKNK